jgi:hypothetical protein
MYGCHDASPLCVKFRGFAGVHSFAMGLTRDAANPTRKSRVGGPFGSTRSRWTSPGTDFRNPQASGFRLQGTQAQAPVTQDFGAEIYFKSCTNTKFSLVMGLQSVRLFSAKHELAKDFLQSI